MIRCNVVVRLSLIALALSTTAQAGLRPRGAPAPLSSRSATAQDQKLDASLRRLLELIAPPGASAQRDASAILADAAREPIVRAGVRPDPLGGEPVATVFARLENEDASRELVARGAEILLQRGDLVIVRVPVSRLPSAAASPSVVSMALSQRWDAVIDSSRIRTGARSVHQGTGLPQAYRGQGVLVGVLDSGIDYTHDDFRTSATNSRLVGLLDFSQGPQPGGPGVECRPGQLDSLTCLEKDGTGAVGHGTHVTGIAAGNGRRNPAYVGMAPEADLLFVKGIRDAESAGGFTDADVVNGCAWMLNKAFQEGKPIAINLSLGSQLGAHDGTSLQEQFLDRFSGPGRVIVAAAGNSGGETIHESFTAQGTDLGEALVSPFLVTSDGAAIDLWAPATTNINVGIAVYDPGVYNQPIFVSNESAAPGQLLQGTIQTSSEILGNVSIDARTTADQNNGGRNVLIQVTPANGGIDPATKVWAIYTFGSGTLDMWCINGIFMPGSVTGIPPFFRTGDDNKTIGIPGTAKRVICVGSHVSKTQWIDVDDQVQIQGGATLDAISGFSSRGPSRDGRILPNITAPGEAIISALSKDFPASNQNTAQGGGYQKQQGTSQAAPHIAGITALMLQRDPALTPENVRTILQQTAQAAGGSVPNNTFGAGRVRAQAALQATPDPLQCTVVLPSGAEVACADLAGQPLSVMAYPNPTPGRVRVSFLVPARQRVHLALYDAMGRRVRTLINGDLPAGTQSAEWNGDDDHSRLLPSGLYFAKLLTAGGARSIRLMLTR